jgi:septation ring formation regulator EzrA
MQNNRIRKVKEGIKQYRTRTSQADPIEALQWHAGSMQDGQLIPI